MKGAKREKRKRDEDLDEVTLSKKDLEDLIYSALKKRQKVVNFEEEEEEEQKQVNSKLKNKNLEEKIRYIFKDVMRDEKIKVEQTGHTQQKKEPIYQYVFVVAFPNSISYVDLAQLYAVPEVVHLEITEVEELGCIGVKVIVSKDRSLRRSYAYSDLMNTKKPTTEASSIPESLKFLITSNLDIENTEHSSSSEKLNSDGEKISVLRNVVRGPIRFENLKRLSQNPIVLNIYISPTRHSNKITTYLELFNQI